MTSSLITGVQGPTVSIPTGTPSGGGDGPVVQSLASELDSHWEQVTSATLGYYLHRGTVYLTGAVQPDLSATGSFRTIYTGLPSTIRPAAPQPLVLPLIRAGMPVINPPAITVPTSLAATVYPDGTLTLDSELADIFLNAPSETDYWCYSTSGTLTDPPPKLPLYAAPVQCQVMLANASWPLDAVGDSLTLTPLAPFLDADVSDDSSGYQQHGTRSHLAGAVTVASIQTYDPGTTVDPPGSPVIVTDELDPDMVPLDGYSLTTVRRRGELWAAEVNFGQVALFQPFNEGYDSGGVALPANPTTSPGLGWSDGNHNYVGYTAGLGIGMVAGGLAGSYSAPDHTSNLDLHAIFDVDALIPMVSPTPDWFALTLFLTMTSGVNVPGDPFGEDLNTKGDATINGPVGASIHWPGPLGLPGAREFGFVVPASPAFSGTVVSSGWPVPGGGLESVGAIDPSWLWRTADWPGGSFDVHPYAIEGYFYQANVQYCGLGILPFWEQPDANMLVPGDVIDLTGTGWEGVGAGPATPSIVIAGVGAAGAIWRGRLIAGVQGP